MMFEFEMLPRLKDVRQILVKHPTKVYRKRKLSHINHLTIHHSLTTKGSAEAFAKYHVNDLHWPGIGYHFVVEQDGCIKWCNNIDDIAYYVGNSNGFTIGICMTGDFRAQTPTAAQWNSLYKLIKALMLDFDIPKENIWGHSEFKDYSWKACPCVVMRDVRDAADITLRSAVPLQSLNPDPQYHTVKKGDTFWSISEALPHINLGELLTLNKGMDPKSLKPGDKIIIRQS